MTLLTALGLASVAFVAVFTARAYRDNTAGNGQSRRSAIIEAWVNILIGFTINYGMNLALLPLVGAHLCRQWRYEGLKFAINLNVVHN